MQNYLFKRIISDLIKNDIRPTIKKKKKNSGAMHCAATNYSLLNIYSTTNLSINTLSPEINLAKYTPGFRS